MLNTVNSVGKDDAGKEKSKSTQRRRGATNPPTQPIRNVVEPQHAAFEAPSVKVVFVECKKINIDGVWYSELKLGKPQENMKLESTRELSDIDLCIDLCFDFVDNFVLVPRTKLSENNVLFLAISTLYK